MKQYGILVPKLKQSSVLYKDITVYEMMDKTIIKSFKYDYYGNKKEQFNLPEHEHCRYVDMENVTSGAPSFLLNDQQIMILFEREDAAYLQKLVFLEDIKDLFHKQQENDLKDFTTQIPINISDIVKKQLKKYPEIML